MYVCVCSVLVQSQLSGKYIASGHGGRLKPSTAIYVAIHVTTTISEGIFYSWWPAIAGGQYYIDTHSKCMQDNMSKYCSEEVIKHFDMHTSTVQSHPPHQSCTHAQTHAALLQVVHVVGRVKGTNSLTGKCCACLCAYMAVPFFVLDPKLLMNLLYRHVQTTDHHL